MPIIERVTTSEGIERVAALADEIWNQHFPSIIGQAQVDYMLSTLQSAAAIASQIREQGYEYYVVLAKAEEAGYFAIKAGGEELTMQLSKLYLKAAWRGRGLGRFVVEWIEAVCSSRRLREIWLSVNKHNRDSIAFYERAGFEIASEVVTDIGGGFVMDDYVMRKPIA